MILVNLSSEPAGITKRFGLRVEMRPSTWSRTGKAIKERQRTDCDSGVDYVETF